MRTFSAGDMALALIRLKVSFRLIRSGITRHTVRLFVSEFSSQFESFLALWLLDTFICIEVVPRKNTWCRHTACTCYLA